MKRYLLGFLTALAGLVALAAQPAQAQSILNRPQAPSFNPAFSPYLNLLRRGNSPFYNYFGLTLPELEGRRAAGQLQQQITNNQQAISTLAQNQQQLEQTVLLPDTGGKPIGYMTHWKYFGGGQGGGGASARRR
jgi:hypothetical protein